MPAGQKSDPKRVWGMSFFDPGDIDQEFGLLDGSGYFVLGED
jgi:hypothetical protein